MNAAFIIDTSITMAWCFADEATKATESLRDRLEHEGVVVPSHWHLEVTNVLAMAEKRKRITAEKADEFLKLLETFGVEVDHDVSSRAFAQVLPLARANRLTTYDAAYLDLALRRGLPLASLDDDLRDAAKKAGVAVLGK